MAVFKLWERESRPGCHEIVVEGELDLAVSEQLESALDGAIGGQDDVLIDLQPCEFIDARALAIMLRAQERLRRRDRRLLLYGVQGQVRRMFSITGLLDKDLFVAERHGVWGDAVRGILSPEAQVLTGRSG